MRLLAFFRTLWCLLRWPTHDLCQEWEWEPRTDGLQSARGVWRCRRCQSVVMRGHWSCPQ